jgi:hypothetical protein
MWMVIITLVLVLGGILGLALVDQADGRVIASVL